MRLLADENFPAEAVQVLRERGHDVYWILTEAAGSSDEAVLATAVAENRLLITFDKDFGELAFRSGLATSGIVLFRIRPVSATYIAQTAATVLGSRTDWQEHFSVVEATRIRMTPLPASKSQSDDQ